METTTIGKQHLLISRVGLGGHYKAMEEGSYEGRYAYVEVEVAARTELVRRAIEGGIRYFDTTWRNEVAMLGAILERLGARQEVVVNGMVLGAFTGSKASGQSVEEYFNRWLDARLSLMPGGRFDAFMINAIEEGYNEAECERLWRVMERRRAQGDFDLAGFSCHDPFLARQVADRFPGFETVMVPYNFHNRKFEQAFRGYTGAAALIAMKPLVWLEYGIPFCATNALPDFRQWFGFEPDPHAASRALRFLRANPQISAVICAANSMQEIEELILAGEGPFTGQDQQVLEQYQRAAALDESVPLYLGGLLHDNLRMNYFGAVHLSRALGVEMPSIALNEPGAQEQIRAYAAGLVERARRSGRSLPQPA
jgi:aryl-alcohol dehydrogenase-like predicted oxidoreductase